MSYMENPPIRAQEAAIARTSFARILCTWAFSVEQLDNTKLIQFLIQIEREAFESSLPVSMRVTNKASSELFLPSLFVRSR